MAGKRLLVELIGALAIIALAAANGCGSGKGAAGSAPAAATRMSLLTKFDVNAKTGKVSITRLDSKGKAVLTGGAVSFTSSDLLLVGGDSGKRLVHISVQNNSGETLPASCRMIVGNLANGASADLKANTITSTFAGSGTASDVDGYGTAATFNAPGDTTAGAGPSSTSVFVSEISGHNIRQMSLDSSVVNLAGLGGTSGNVPLGITDTATGTSARFNTPGQTAVDPDGNIFVADTGNNKIRRITPLGEVTTIAGSGTGGSTDGTSGSDATFTSPIGLVASSGRTDIYVCSAGASNTDNTVRRLSWNGVGARNKAASYTVTTIAGAAATGNPTTDGSGTLARFNAPTRLSLVTDSTGDETLYVTDQGNNVIRRITGLTSTASSSVVSTVAGGGSTSPYNTSGTSDGTGSSGGLFSNLYGIAGLSISPGVHVLFVTENGASNSRVRQVTYTAGNEPQQRGNYNISTLAGGSSGGAVDGDGTAAVFNLPRGLTAIPAPGGSATLYVADYANNKIRKVNVSSAALHSGSTVFSGSESVRLVNWDSEVPHQTAWVKTITPSSNGPGYSADLQFFVPNGVSGFSFTAYVEADTNLVNLPGTTSAFVTTLAGDGIVGDNIGPGKNAEFRNPSYVAPVPPGLQSAYSGVSLVRAFLGDSYNNRIKYIDANSNVGNFAGSGDAGSVDGLGTAASFNNPRGIGIAPDGTLFVADLSGSRIRRISTGGNVTTIAGTGTVGFTDGTGAAALFNGPVGVAVDPGGAIFVTDFYNQNVRRIAYAGGDPALAASYRVSTVAGPTTGPTAGYTDGVGTTARFDGPAGIACDSDGKIFVADSNNHAIRLLTRTATQMQVTTIAGSYPTKLSGTTDGNGTSARFNGPWGIVVDAAHNVYIADTSNHRIRRMSPLYDVKTLIGSSSGFTDSTVSTQGTFSNPRGVAVESTGNLLVVDYTNSALRVIQRVITDAQPTSH